MQDVVGKVAVITGAAGGIGLGAARAFVAAGMRVVLADIDEERLAASAGALTAAGGDVRAVPVDVRDRASVDGLRDEALATFGSVHLICNNAGGPLPRLTQDVTSADWEFVLGLNLFGVINGVQSFLPLFEDQGEGHISATASMSGLVPRPPVVTYNVAKAGVVAFMETLDQELRAANSPVKVSVLCPGEVATHGIEHAVGLAASVGHRMSDWESSTAVAAQTHLLSEGLDADEAGRVLLEGIRAGRFWIFTHPEWITGPLSQRHEAMLRQLKTSRL